MKNNIAALALCTVLASSALAGCGSSGQNAGSVKESAKENVTKSTTDSSEKDGPISMEEGKHDASKKDNTYEADEKAVNEAKKGSLDTISGAYDSITKEGAENNTKYVFTDKKLIFITKGTYEFTKDGIKLQHGSTKEQTYKITETKAGFNLSQGKDQVIPLVYMGGTDGLMGNKPFDGVYSIASVQGYVFHKDGTLSVITSSDLKVKKDKVSFGSGEFTWKVNDGKIELSSHDTVVITLKP